MSAVKTTGKNRQRVIMTVRSVCIFGPENKVIKRKPTPGGLRSVKYDSNFIGAVLFTYRYSMVGHIIALLIVVSW